MTPGLPLPATTGRHAREGTSEDENRVQHSTPGVLHLQDFQSMIHKSLCEHFPWRPRQDSNLRHAV
jgi:hypothetical protein